MRPRHPRLTLDPLALAVLAATLCSATHSLAQELCSAPTPSSVTAPRDSRPAASDIVSLHSTPYGEAPVPVLKAFRIDCVGWGLPPQRESEVDGWARAWIQQHLGAGVRYHAVVNLNISNGYLTGPEPGLLATRCLTAAGEPRGPGHTGVLGVINGQPSWYHCVNHPAWRAQLRKQVGYAIAAGAQGFEFDDPRSGASSDFRKEGLCFCDHCLAGFENSSPGLALSGAALKAHLATQMATTPLYSSDEILQRYCAFQLRSAVQCMEELIAHARAVGGEGLEFTVNAFDMRPESLAFVPPCDWLLTEMSHYADLWNDGTLTRSLAWRYRLADAFGKRMVATAPLWEWRQLQDNKWDALLKLWFAAAYAHGHLFAVPNYYDWSGIPYRGKAEEWAPLTQFVKDNAELLADYVHAPAAAVVYSPDDLSDITGAVPDKPIAEIMDIATTFAYRHLDFDFAIATNRLFAAPQWPEAPLLVLPETAKLSPADQERLKPFEDAGRLIRWPQDRMRIEPLKTIEAPAGVWIKPRVHRSDPRRRVLHLINGRFDYANNRVQSMAGFPLVIGVPEDWQSVQAVYHAPGKEPTPLAVTLAGGKAEVSIPALDFWGLLALTGDDGPRAG